MLAEATKDLTVLKIEYAERGKEDDTYLTLLTCCKSNIGPVRALLRKITDTEERRRSKRKHTQQYKIYTDRLNVFYSELPRIAKAERLFDVLFKKWQQDRATGSMYLSLLDIYEKYIQLAESTESADAADYRAILDALRAYDPVSALQEKIAERKSQKKRNALLQVALNDLIVLENPALAEAS